MNSPVTLMSQHSPLAAAELDRIPVDLEVPVTWFPSQLDGERHRAMFSQLCSVLASRPIDVHLKPVAHGMHDVPRRPRPNGVVFSYHSIGTERNVWRIKETPIAGWYSFDPNGFSGWSSLAKFPASHMSRIRGCEPNASLAYVQQLKEKLRIRNASKYSQSAEAFTLDRPYVYFPLQLIDDPVSEFCRLNPFDVIVRAAEMAQQSGYALVLKRHPLCRSSVVAQVLGEVQKAFSSVVISNASIHQHLEGCRAVIVANSGVGMEALMYLKPVFSFASSEYELATTSISSLEELDAAFAPELPDNAAWMAQFLNYYLEQCCFSIYDTNTIERQVSRALVGVSAVVKSGASERDATSSHEGSALSASLAEAQAETARLREVATQAVELAARLEKQLASQSGSQEASSPASANAIAAATEVAMRLHEGGMAASVGEAVLGGTIRSAYSAYAEMAVTAMRSPELKRQVEVEIMSSAYAAGMDPTLAHKNRTANDYQRLHDHDRGYQDNNWLVDHCDVISSVKPEVVVEVGCGNGRFLRKIAPLVPNVVGLDWARAPQLAVIPDNVEFRTTDVLKDEIPNGSVCVSADVLEHFEPHALPALIKKLHEAARFNYHVIACYDDGHSHCSVFHPGQWLALFKTISPDYRLVATITRPGRPDRIACVITNISGTERFFPKLGPLTGGWETDTGQKINFASNFSFEAGGTKAGAWFPMANGTGAMKWNGGNIDYVSLSADGSTLSVRNMEGGSFSVKRSS
ncbi:MULTISPECIES: hypothetical protein [unclassified Rhizobium]|uniref:capsular polysaccharide export protein, LipB/KpsS family n=1 Tax=unclassified Rhizobium TaxID=2613769 RepID=UPI0028894370|nr:MULTISPECIES: hypothetical protein [unclassified Rhizobium]